MADVAAAAGVSKQTVSNVLNYPERVRPETRERVERAVAELDFQPNRLARALKASSSGMIACRIEPIASDALTSWQDRFLHALVEAGQASERHVMLFAADDAEQEAATCIRLWRTGTVDGVVICDPRPDDIRPAQLLVAQVPFVCFGRASEHGGEVSWVDIDNTRGVELVVDHLVDAGHRRIGFLGFPDGHRVGDDRSNGWVAAMDRHGLLAGSYRLDVRGQDTFTSGAKMARQLLERADPPTALIAVSDTLAAGALQAVRDLGLTPGDQVALVGYDDTPSAEVMDLSSVRQPLSHAGAEIVQALIPGQAGSAPLSVLLEPELIVRGSSRRGLTRRREEPAIT
ncbi:LacI family DNA-binding transcriptional regulator [Dactylosporangium sp. NPDC048998]|uniref:LacI family DNA-binding transcriptional regulator n=1 Tax=Dactylosporangium sp. NPDC048998 TaxID=3363976 RepID=UPI00372239EB